MGRAHLAIGSLSFVAVLCGVLAFVAADPDVAPSSTALIAVGAVIAATAALAGLLLARAPWGRWSLAALVIGAMALAASDDGPLVFVTWIVGAVALVGLFGPWLRIWVRHHRSADAPGPVVVALIASGPVAPLAVGLATAPGGAAVIDWVLAGTALVASALYGRGAWLGRWLLRVVVPILGSISAIAADGLVGSLAVGAMALGVGVLAWLPAAGRTTTVIAPVLPEPVDRAGRRAST